MSAKRKVIDEITLSSDESDAEQTISPRINLYSSRGEKMSTKKTSKHYNYADGTLLNFYESHDIEIITKYRTTSKNATSSIIHSDNVSSFEESESDDDLSIIEIEKNNDKQEVALDLSKKSNDNTNAKQYRSFLQKEITSTNVEIYKSTSINEREHQNTLINENESNKSLDNNLKDKEKNVNNFSNIQLSLAALNTFLSVQSNLKKDSKPKEEKLVLKSFGAKPPYIRIKRFAQVYCKTCQSSKCLGKRKIETVNCSKCTGTLVYRCKKCNGEFITFITLSIHVKKCLRSALWNCKHCSYVSVSQANLESHENRVHSEVDEEDLKLCNNCKSTFKLAKEFKHHVKNCELVTKTKVKKKKKKIESIVKPVTSTDKSDVIKDDEKTDEKTAVPTNSKASTAVGKLSTERKIIDEKSSVEDLLVLYCENCKASQKSGNNNKKTICFNCNKPLVWQCIKCKLCSKSYCGIYDHIKTQCDKQCKCLNCNEGFANDEKLKAHKSACKKVFKCKLCNLQTKSRISYERHVKMSHKENILPAHPRR